MREEPGILRSSDVAPAGVRADHHTLCLTLARRAGLCKTGVGCILSRTGRPDTYLA